MEQIELHVTKRDVLGKKVRFMRRNGITPVHLFGHNVESLSLQCETVALKKALSQAGKTKIINLQVDRSRKPRTVMVRETQKNAITGDLLHVDLYQIVATERVKVQVPITLTGEAPALRSKDNLLEHELMALSVECLPAQIPDRIQVDISTLADDNSAIRIKDIRVGEGITVLLDLERIVVKIGKRYAERVEVAAAAEAAAPEAEAAEAPAAEEKAKEARPEKETREPKADKKAKA
jgi:large subunit ribosomal protein L25